MQWDIAVTYDEQHRFEFQREAEKLLEQLMAQRRQTEQTTKNLNFAAWTPRQLQTQQLAIAHEVHRQLDQEIQDIELLLEDLQLYTALLPTTH